MMSACAQSSWDTQPIFLGQTGTGAEAFMPALMPLWLGRSLPPHPSVSPDLDEETLPKHVSVWWRGEGGDKAPRVSRAC